ncbi:MAG: ABC transporter permease, partial [Longimicrobiales bacterium]
MKGEPMWRRYARLLGANPRRDAEDELSFHYEMRVRDYRRRGLDEAAARAAARERLGDVDAIERTCAEMGEAYMREDRRREWLGELRQDAKYGLRVLLRSPVFAVVSVLTLALGIGANTAIFSVVHRVLLAPLSYPDAERLVHVWEHSPQGEDHNVVSSGNYADWTRRARSFAVLGAHMGTYGLALTGVGDPQQITVNSLTPSALRVLNAAPLLGRALNSDDEQGSGDVVVVSQAFWRQYLGSDRQLERRSLVLNERTYKVVGVMPADFAFPDEGVQVWLPMLPGDLNPEERRSHNYHVIGRLAPGVTVEQAQEEMTSIARALASEHPQHMSGWGVNVVSMHSDLTRNVRPLLLVLFGTVIVVLLIACGNLANLLLARAVAREGEFALRGALG